MSRYTVIHDLNIRDFTYVLANLRAEDREELKALVPVGFPIDKYSMLFAQAAFQGKAYSVHIKDEPVAVFGVGVSSAYSTAIGWAFGSTNFKRATPSISQFMWNKLSHELRDAGILRLEARALTKHMFARQWLKNMGFHEDCELKCYGTSGESFHLYSMTIADYNKKFKKELH